MYRPIVSLLFVLAFVCNCESADLEVSIRFNKPVYRVGDQLKGIIQFTNRSAVPIRLLPFDTIYAAGELEFKSANTHKHSILVGGGDFFDFQSLAAQVITLQPGKTFVRQLEADVRCDFRRPYNDSRHGLVLDFPASALLLPSFGKYTVTKKFKEDSDDPVVHYLRKGAPFWNGSVKSLPVTVEFRPK